MKHEDKGETLLSIIHDTDSSCYYCFLTDIVLLNNFLKPDLYHTG